MKKVVLALGVIAMVACFSSCKKDCKCVTKVNGVEMGSVTEKSKKCSDLEATVETPAGKSVTTCTEE